MIFLILTFCTTAALDDCEVHQLGRTESVQQCEAVADIYRDTLGREGDLNYRLECVSEDEQ
jgi:hypothetical protein